MRPHPFLVALALGLAACSGGDGDSAASTTVPSGSDSGCPVEPDAVSAALGVEVTLDEASATTASCTFDATGNEHDGGRVVVAVERLAEGQDLTEARAAAAADGPLVELPAGLVPGADAGWVQAAGRAVQVAALHDRRLVVVAVADPALEAAEAQAVAATLAGQVLGG